MVRITDLALYFFSKDHRIDISFIWISFIDKWTFTSEFLIRYSSLELKYLEILPLNFRLANPSSLEDPEISRHLDSRVRP